MNVRVLVMSLHIIWHDLLGFFPKCNKTLLHCFIPYITVYLRWKCVLVLIAMQ